MQPDGNVAPRRLVEERLELRRIEGMTRRVYNLGTVAVSGNTWVLACRSKAGQLYATQVGEEEVEKQILELSFCHTLTETHNEAYTTRN